MTKPAYGPNPVIASALKRFGAQKQLADRAVTQLTDDQLHNPLDAETNSVAVIMKHIAGNMRSRWTDFLTQDGEKPWRDRDSEFIDDMAPREELQRMWEDGWSCLLDALSGLNDDDLGRQVVIRGTPHTVIEAIDRQIGHCGYHIGQIVLVARILAQDNWTTLSIPRGGSDAYDQRVWKT